MTISKTEMELPKLPTLATDIQESNTRIACQEPGSSIFSTSKLILRRAPCAASRGKVSPDASPHETLLPALSLKGSQPASPRNC